MDTEQLLSRIILKLSEGNPGACTAAMDLISFSENGHLHLWLLTLNNITGWKLWVAYKDVCGKDLNKLIELIESEKLLEALENNEAYKRQV